MALELPGRDRLLTREVLGRWLRDMFAGSICGVLSIAFGLSYAVLIFSGPLTPWLTYGVATVPKWHFHSEYVRKNGTSRLLVRSTHGG